jgi:hypothetical protein
MASSKPDASFFSKRIIQFYEMHKKNLLERFEKREISYEQAKNIIDRYKTIVAFLSQWATENYKDYEIEISKLPPRHISSKFHIHASTRLTNEELNDLYHFREKPPTLEDKEPKKRKRSTTPNRQTEPDIIRSAVPIKLKLTPTLFIAAVLYYYSVMTESDGDYLTTSKEQTVYTKTGSTFSMYYVDPSTGNFIRNKLAFTDMDDHYDDEVVAECINLLTAHVSIKDAEYHYRNPQSLRGTPLISLVPLYLKSPVPSPTKPPPPSAPSKYPKTMARRYNLNNIEGGSKRKRTIKKSKHFTRTRKNR